MSGRRRQPDSDFDIVANEGLQPGACRITLPAMSPSAAMLRVQRGGLALAFLAGCGFAAAAGFWDDRAVKVIQTVDMQFPPSLLLNGTTQGQVRVVMEVDADGKLADFLVTGFTHRELALELQRSLPTFDFEPARQRGQPIRCRFEAVFTFEAHGAVLSLTPMATVGAYLRHTLTDEMTGMLARASELDQPLAAVHQIAPAHPRASRSRLPAAGSVQIDFYIDGEGRPRMPVVLRSTRDEFALAAVDALLQWRFAPPTRQGRPVAVRVVQEFVFAPDAATPARSS